MKLQTRVLASFVAGALIVSGGIILFTRKAVESIILEAVESRGAARGARLAQEAAAGLQSPSERDLLHLLQAAAEELGAVYAIALDPGGRVLAHTRILEAGAVYEDPATLKAMAAQAPTASRLSFEGRPVLELGIPIWESTGEFLLSGEQSRPQRRLGTLRLGLPLEHALETERRILGRITAIMGAAWVLALGLIALLLRSVLRPVRLLGRATQRVAAGVYDVQVPVVSGDELGDLARSFNAMSETLAQTTVSKDYLHAVLENMRDPLFVVDTNGTLQTVNQAAMDVLGYCEAELVGQPAKRIFSEPRSASIRGQVERLLRHGIARDIELTFRCKKGREIPALVSGAAWKGKDGRLLGVIVVAKDITELRRAAEELERQRAELARSNADLAMFASVASHDLQEPLRKITAFGDLLKEQASALDDRGREHLAVIQRSAARMRQLIEGLLKYSRASLMPQKLETVALEDVLQGVLSDLEVRIAQEGARVEVGELPKVWANPLQMRLLFQNLLSNALKFRKPENPACVRVRGRQVDPQRVEIVVEDEGIGFEERHLSLIFKPFERLHSWRDYEGSGMGLAICQKVVERDGGTLTASSVPGKGATFCVTLPGTLRGIDGGPAESGSKDAADSGPKAAGEAVPDDRRGGARRAYDKEADGRAAEDRGRRR